MLGQLPRYSHYNFQFSTSGDHLYFTIAHHARVKIFVVSIPPTPKQPIVAQDLPAHYTTPVQLTSSHVSSAIQPLSSGRLLFTRSSLTSPNDVFVLRGLDQLERRPPNQDPIVYRGEPEQITRFTDDVLRGKGLAEGEDFWFSSAGNDVHGWFLKPKGWKAGEKKKWPVVLLIHGGLLDVFICYGTLKTNIYTSFRRTTICLGRFVVNPLESERFCPTRLFCSCHQSNRINGLWPRLVMVLLAYHTPIQFFTHSTPAQNLRMLSQKTGVVSHLSTYETGGNMRLINTLRFACDRLAAGGLSDLKID